MILPARYRPTANIAFKVFKFCIKLVTSFRIASEFATRNVNSAKTACIRSHTRKTYLHNTHDDISGQSFDHEGGQRAANWDDSARCFESIDYRRRTRYRNFHGIRKNLVQLFSTGSFRIREGNRPKLDSSRLVSPVVFRKKGRVEALMIDSPSPRLAETGKF